MDIRLLIVDDHPTVREALRCVFEAAGMTGVEDVSSCEDAIRVVRQQRRDRVLVDAVLLDIVLPDGSGLDVLAEIKSLDSTLPVLMHSYQDNPCPLVLSYQRGASGYLIKGEDKNLLIEAVRRVVLGQTAWTAEQLEQIEELKEVYAADQPSERRPNLTYTTYSGRNDG